MDGFGTHLPVLAAVVRRLSHPRVLELGMGDYSTPMLHVEAAAQRAYVRSLEANAEWAARYAAMACPQHELAVVEWDRVAAEPWDVVFMDCGPTEARAPLLARLLGSCKYMVIHDTDACCYRYEPILSMAPYRRDFRRWLPWTSIVSLTEPLEWADRDLAWMAG